MRHHLHPSSTLACLLLAMTALGASGGCNVAGVAGVMAESYKRSSTHAIAPEYDGLTGKSFAVVVSVDMIIQAEDPRLASQITNALTTRLAGNTKASGFVPGTLVLNYQFNNPRWRAMDYEQLADHFGVDRLIYVEIIEHRLREPGNAYIWQGYTAATIGVYEADGPLRDDFVFSKEKVVKFPDEKGYSPTDYTAQEIGDRLKRRLVDRLSWLFYEHQEPYYPKY